MSISDLFDSPKSLLSRARHHIRDLDNRRKAYLESLPYQSITTPDVKTGEFLLQLKLTRPIPSDLSVIAFDAITNLRSALDHAAFAASIALNPQADQRRIKFPTGKDLARFEKDIKTGCQGMHTKVLDVIRAIKPYGSGNVGQEGNSDLFALTEIANQKKHRALVPVAIEQTGAVVPKASRGDTPVFAPHWDAASNVLTVYRCKTGAGLVYGGPLVDIALDGEVFSSRAATQTLDDIALTVESVITRLEVETKKIIDGHG